MANTFTRCFYSLHSLHHGQDPPLELKWPHPLFFLFFPSASPLILHATQALPFLTARFAPARNSVFDLALGCAFTPPVDFDFRAAIQQRLAEEQARLATEDEVTHHEDHEDNTSDAALLHAQDNAPALAPLPVLSAKQSDKQKSRARHDKKREEAQAVSTNPALKLVTHKHVNEAKTCPLAADVDTVGLPHSQHSWVGACAAQDLPFQFTDPTPAPKISDVAPPKALCTFHGADSMSPPLSFFCCHTNLRIPRATIPVVDRGRHVITVFGGCPHDAAGWKKVTDGAACLLGEHLDRIRLPQDRLHHHHAQESFPALAHGLLQGGGQTEPGELQNNVANTKLTDELLASEPFLRIAHFTNILFTMWAPLLFTFYTAVFTACTFNFGPWTIYAPHLDFANLTWGWGSSYSLGPLNGDSLSPPGSTILIPSPLIHPFTHNNTNYISDTDHDENSRKFWFLVFGRGLYTKKADADVAAEHVDGVHIFKTHAQATRAWARHCHRRHTDGCHKTTGARAYESNTDSDTDDDTEGPKSACTGARSHCEPQDVHQARVRRVNPARRAQRVESAHRVCQARAQCINPARTVRQARGFGAVKHAPSASVPVMCCTIKAELVSPPKKIPLYADCEDSNLKEDLFKSDLSIEVPLAASRAALWPKSVLSTLDEDEDMLMPPASAPPTTNLFSPTVSSALSLSTTSMVPSIYSSVSESLAARVASAPTAPATSSSGGRGSPRVATGSRGHPVSISVHLLYNRRTGVLYEDPEKVVEEMGRGDSMEVVNAAMLRNG
ncbi:hypothetical protein B0H14DRAFT_3539898 [Mycena olivaceomarginata]|nr:hypothetical protein B0H14DRAFT_3539898 [Mycena olivaceomarginata]